MGDLHPNNKRVDPPYDRLAKPTKALNWTVKHKLSFSPSRANLLLTDCVTKQVPWWAGYSKLVHQSGLLTSPSVTWLVEHCCVSELPWGSTYSATTPNYICTLGYIQLVSLNFMVQVLFERDTGRKTWRQNCALWCAVHTTNSLQAPRVTCGSHWIFVCCCFNEDTVGTKFSGVGDLCCTFWLIQPIWAWFFPFIEHPLEQTVLWKSSKEWQTEQLRSVLFSGLVSDNKIPSHPHCYLVLPIRRSHGVKSYYETCWTLDRYPRRIFRCE